MTLQNTTLLVVFARIFLGIFFDVEPHLFQGVDELEVRIRRRQL